MDASTRRRRSCAGAACTGTVPLDHRGRWFVDADWLPIDNRGGRTTLAAPSRYAYEPPTVRSSAVKYVGGAVLYAIMAALLAATIIADRNAARGSSVAAANASAWSPRCRTTAA